jgi:hypothetical protein
VSRTVLEFVVTREMAFGTQRYVFGAVSNSTHEQGTNKHTEGSNRQMDHSRSILLDLLPMVRRRAHPRQAAVTSRETPLGIPSSTSPCMHTFIDPSISIAT